MKSFLFLLLFFSLSNGSSEFENIKSQYFKSYDYEQMQKYKEAIKVLSPLYQVYPNGYTLNLRFGWLFYLDKKYSDAIVYYKKASLINPHSVEPKLGLARTYLQASSFKDAERECEQIIKIDYYNYYANLYIAKALIAQKKYDTAIEIINKMVVIYPTDIFYLEQLSIVYKLTNNLYLQQLYEDILILDPNNVLVRSIVGLSGY
jgi:tetratricopeptide (TPR) repeat protein